MPVVVIPKPRLRLTALRPVGAGAVLDCAWLVAIHVGTAVAFVRGGTGRLVALAAALYAVRMVAVGAGYHRYFAHRAYRTSRGAQLVLAVLGTTALLKGPLWWASQHRRYHRAPDAVGQGPCRHSMAWLGRRHEGPHLELVPDLLGYPELRLVERWSALGALALAALLLAAGGLDALLWGYAVSTCFLLHATSTLGALTSVLGTRRYATRDASRNNVVVSLVTLGEGWDNNHHHTMNSARHGFFWWEIDLTHALLSLLAKVGVVWALREVPAHARGRNLVSAVSRPSAADVRAPSPSLVITSAPRL